MNDASIPTPQPPPGATPTGYSAWQGWYAPPALPPAPPEKDYPQPAARRTPLLWAITLLTITTLSLALAFGARAQNPAAPARAGAAVYSSSLARDDGAFTLGSINGQCAFANGGLDATANLNNHVAPVCALNQSVGHNFWLSARVLPESLLSAPLTVALLFHQGAAAVFIDNKGAYEISERDEENNGSFAYFPLSSGYAAQWHTDGYEANTVVVQAQDGFLTLGVNGVQVAQARVTGGVAINGITQDIVLGTAGDASGQGEALYADLVVNSL
jgi:hypothetical protein